MPSQSALNTIESAALNHMVQVYLASSENDMHEKVTRGGAELRPVMDRGTDDEKAAVIRGLVSAVTNLDPHYLPTKHGSIDLALNAFLGNGETYSAYTVSEGVAKAWRDHLRIHASCRAPGAYTL